MLARGLLVLMFACAVNVTEAAGEVPQNRKLWVDKADQEVFIQELKARGITFTIDKDGGVWYRADKVKEVDEISRSILERSKQSSEFSFEDKEDQTLFRDRLEAARIPYTVSHRLGRDWVVWDKAYDDKVRPIQEAVEDDGIRRAKIRRYRNH